MAVPDWAVILGRGSWTSLLFTEVLCQHFLPILPGLGSGWKGCSAHVVPPSVEPLVFSPGSLGVTCPPCTPPQQP